MFFIGHAISVSARLALSKVNDANNFAAKMLTPTVLSLGRVVGKRGNSKILYMIFGIIEMLILLLSVSRRGWVAFEASISVLLIVSQKHTKRLNLATVNYFTTIFIVLVWPKISESIR